MSADRDIGNSTHSGYYQSVFGPSKLLLPCLCWGWQQTTSGWGNFQMFTRRLVRHIPLFCKCLAVNLGWQPGHLGKATCLISSQSPSARAWCPPRPGRQLTRRLQKELHRIASPLGTMPGLASQECSARKQKYRVRMVWAYALLIHNGRVSVWNLWFVQGLL